MFGLMGSTSATNLMQYEERILSSISDLIHQEFVYIGNNHFISTLSVKAAASHSCATTPLVFLHGVGTGAALWVLNMKGVATQRTVYAVDMLGFGRSSRVVFSNDPAVAEIEFVESLEAWRHALHLDNFILVGHCFGGFIATSYALRYPNCVRHLFLVSPWGFSEQKSDANSTNAIRDRQLPMPLWVKILALLLQPFNPFAALRVAGSWGPALVTRFKPDLIQKYSHLFSDDTVAQYIYHWNAQTPSGETAFKHMSYDFGWARYPMMHRVKDITASLPMTIIIGARSSTDSNICQQIQELRCDSFVDTHIVGGAGHFVFADKAELFNHLVQHVCTLVDHQLDLPPRRPAHSRLRRVSSDVGHSLPIVSQTRLRRCDSQHIAEEEAPVCVELGSAVSTNDETSQPVFVVADEELI